MLDIQLIRDDPDFVESNLQSKDPSVSLKPVIQLDEKLRQNITEVEKLKSERNKLSKQIGEKKRLKEDTSELLKNVGEYGNQIEKLDQHVLEDQRKMQELLANLPNLASNEVKVSLNKDDNECLHSHGKPKIFNFPVKNHLELGEMHQLFDFNRGAKISGSGWPVYFGMGARLEWALINMMLDFHIENGFTQWMTPLLVRQEMMYAAGQFPKFRDQAYELKDKQFDLSLLPTAEVALNALHTDEIIEVDDLPKKYVAYTPCFRREAGAAGKNERGLIRTHQFNKVEMFAFCTPKNSERIFEDFVAHAEELLKLLELPFKRMLLVSGDMSFSGAKTIDIEVYLPGQEKYMEVSSISNCTDFQARRSKIRYREKGEKPRFVHTLNGSGLATSRVMVALLENHQLADGSIYIPKALQKYFRGKERLVPKKKNHK